MKNDPHFKMVFWFIVGVCCFGAAFSIFVIMYLPSPEAARIADQAHMFWLSTPVAGCVGYLIGNSAKNSVKQTEQAPGTASVSIEATATTEELKPAEDK